MNIFLQNQASIFNIGNNLMNNKITGYLLFRTKVKHTTEQIESEFSYFTHSILFTSTAVFPFQALKTLSASLFVIKGDGARWQHESINPRHYATSHRHNLLSLDKLHRRRMTDYTSIGTTSALCCKLLPVKLHAQTDECLTNLTSFVV